jgi:predicted lipid-binding transport protein (Tim44 family)
VLVATDVEARRLGGARSLGAQRNVTAPPAKPAQQQAQGAQAKQGQQATPSRWGPILGGLALGGLLGYLFAGNGLGGLLLLALIVVGAILVLRTLARRGQWQAPVQFAGMREHASVELPGSGTPSPVRHALPAGFDAASFLRGAKMNFVKLQLANDAGDLAEIREFTTDEMFEALQPELLARGARQQTEVTNLDADLLEVASEDGKHWASVRFSGTVRESAAAAPAGFEEVWNLVKPIDGSSGWLLAGIQQMH